MTQTLRDGTLAEDGTDRSTEKCRTQPLGFQRPASVPVYDDLEALATERQVLLVYRPFSDSTYSLGRRQATKLFSNPTGPPRIYRRLWEEPDLTLRMWLTRNDTLLTLARTYPEDTLAVFLDMFQGRHVSGRVSGYQGR